MVEGCSNFAIALLLPFRRLDLKVRKAQPHIGVRKGYLDDKKVGESVVSKGSSEQLTTNVKMVATGGMTVSAVLLFSSILRHGCVTHQHFQEHEIANLAKLSSMKGKFKACRINTSKIPLIEPTKKLEARE